MCAKPDTLAFLLRKRVDQDRSWEPQKRDKTGTQNPAKYSSVKSIS